MGRVAVAEWLLRRNVPGDLAISLCARLHRLARPSFPVPKENIGDTDALRDDLIANLTRQAQEDFLVVAAATQASSNASVTAKDWFQKEFVAYNVEVYLPKIHSTLASGMIPPEIPLPKFCRLPDDDAYQPWYDPDDVAGHPGVQALVGSLDQVRGELANLRELREDYLSGGGTAAASTPSENQWSVTGFQRFGETNFDVCQRCPVTWACLQEFALEDCWGEVCLPQNPIDYPKRSVHGSPTACHLPTCAAE
eukprot:m.464379 g.464379  ORF g.464379 m.464379 type:complete len:252 (+) comp23471_c0_seq1:74-829(+)